MKSFDVSRLCLAAFNSKAITDDLKRWKDANNFIAAESCARQIWFGAPDDFSAFPLHSSPNSSLRMMGGEQGYKFLLELILGLHSRYNGETNIAGQFYDSFARQKTSNPSYVSHFDRLVDILKADSRLVRRMALDKWLVQDKSICARDLIDLRSGDTVVLIARKEAFGADNTTDRYFRLACMYERRMAREIIITNPDKRVAEELFSGLSKKRESYCNHTPPVMSWCAFEDLPVAVDVTENVKLISCLPWNMDAQQDGYIQQSWEGKIHPGGKVLIARENAMTSFAGRPMAGNTEVVSPADVSAELARRIQHNKALIAEAEKIIAYCVECRANGAQPSSKTARRMMEPEPVAA